MIDIIKEAAMKAYNASNPLNIEFGVVTDADNLTICINQKRILSKEFFLVPESLTRYVVDLEHSHTCPSGVTNTQLFPLVIREGLKVNDCVILLKIEQGSRYIVLDKVV